MKLALVGVGSGGARIVDRLIERERRVGQLLERDRRVARLIGSDRDVGRIIAGENVLTFDTDRSGLDRPNVPEQRQVLIGDTHPEISDRGTDGDPELAAAVARENVDEIRRAFDAIESHEVDGILLVAGLGGGTGCGAGAVLADEMQSIFERPVYVLGVLPAESEGERLALNAARALQSYVPTTENVLLFDNEAWYSGDGPIEREYEDINDAIATRIGGLFAANDVDPGTVGEQQVDASDVIRTLDTGGVSTIGYAATDVPVDSQGVLSRLRGWWSDSEDDTADDGTTDAVRIKQLVRRAVESRLTLPCDVSSAERVVVVLSGPPERLSRKGFETARYWIEQETDTVEVLAGDVPRENASTLTAVVLFSNVTDVPRIDAMQARAVAARKRTVDWGDGDGGGGGDGDGDGDGQRHGDGAGPERTREDRTEDTQNEQSATPD